MSIQRIKGFADLFPPASSAFTRMENCARAVFDRYGFVELRTPLLEYTELFQRSLGEETDVVSKEMFTFADRKGRSLTLRPEATAGVVRAFIEDGRANRETVSRLFTIGPMFRYERPQMGRMRQFHQINCECLGPDSPVADAELISMLMRFLSDIGVRDLSLKLNSLGCAECRPRYREILAGYLRAVNTDALCDDCARRVEKNPLRVLDCKRDGCRELTRNAPKISDSLCAECAEHFAAVRALLGADSISFDLDHRLVRGLDYYCRTTFEAVSGAIGAQSAVAGGGRYDGLVRDLGGADVPGVGFACGMERLALLLSESGTRRPDFYLLAMNDDFLEMAFLFAHALRDSGLSGLLDSGVGGFKSRMRRAGKSGARYCLIIGADEAAKGTVSIKTMDSGEQVVIPRSQVVRYLQPGDRHE
ncbi:MAG: histidine--tRNA ligase [Desulfovibrio sp.]|jgi:histidyl-tRNA synthetase|nr:histidine--tRNA ligase [Desulfovibrio sp.]